MGVGRNLCFPSTLRCVEFHLKLVRLKFLLGSVLEVLGLVRGFCSTLVPLESKHLFSLRCIPLEECVDPFSCSQLKLELRILLSKLLCLLLYRCSSRRERGARNSVTFLFGVLISLELYRWVT